MTSLKRAGAGDCRPKKRKIMIAPSNIITNRQRIAIGEELIWQQLKEKRVFGLTFARQYPFYLQQPDGERLVYSTDFYCHDAGVAVRIVNCDAVTAEYNEQMAWCKQQLQMRGILVIELPCDAIADLKQVIAVIRRELKYKTIHA